jgi:hypothetical protein
LEDDFYRSLEELGTVEPVTFKMSSAGSSGAPARANAGWTSGDRQKGGAGSLALEPTILMGAFETAKKNLSTAT